MISKRHSVFFLEECNFKYINELKKKILSNGELIIIVYSCQLFHFLFTKLSTILHEVNLIKHSVYFIQILSVLQTNMVQKILGFLFKDYLGLKILLSALTFYLLIEELNVFLFTKPTLTSQVQRDVGNRIYVHFQF